MAWTPHRALRAGLLAAAMLAICAPITRASSDTDQAENGTEVVDSFYKAMGDTPGFEQVEDVEKVVSLLEGGKDDTQEALFDLTLQVTDLSRQLDAVKADVANMRADLTDVVRQTAADHNLALITAVAQENGRNTVNLKDLFPVAPGDVSYSGFRARIRQAGGAASPVSWQTAYHIANDAQTSADDFVNPATQATYWQAADVVMKPESDGQGHTTNQTVRVTAFKPYPALKAYLFSLQVWVSAATIWSQGDPLAVKRQYGPAFARHAAFLTWMAKAGKGPNGTLPLPDQVAGQISCRESMSKYPDKAGQCHRQVGCFDRIALKSVLLPTIASWPQADANSQCTYNPDFAQDLPGASAAAEVYGVKAMTDMAGILNQMAAFGYASPPGPAVPPGSFGGSPTDEATLVIYGVTAEGQVTWYSKAGGATGAWSRPTVVASRWPLVSLTPAGGPDFFAVGQYGQLEWRELGADPRLIHPAASLGTGWTAYPRVFGGADGVIYAIQSDGALLWFRRSATGALEGPLVVGSGWNGFTAVFSAGHGVIYAIKPNGDLVWYRHSDYLTGTTVGPSGPRSGNSSRVFGSAAIVEAAGVPHWSGPITVGNGWAGFKTVVPAGDGVILAIRPNGELDWYKHDDYLTGTSLGQPSAPGGAVMKSRLGRGEEPVPIAHWRGPIAIGTGWDRYAAVAAEVGNSSGSNNIR